MYSQFDKAACTKLRKDLQRVLDAAGLGLQFHVGNMRFTPGEVEIKVGAKIPGAKDRRQDALDDMARLYNLDTAKSAMGMTLHGYDSKKTKYPWIVMDSRDGRLKKLSDQQAQFYFGKAPEQKAV